MRTDRDVMAFGAPIDRLCTDESATLALGLALAHAIPPSPSRALRVYLRGELGAGKTTLVRGVLQALGESGPVRSPTYAVLHTYELPSWVCAHLDLYRLHDAEDLRALGLGDLDRAGTLWLIEWPERAGAHLPPADLDITLASTATGHTVRVQAGSELGELWLARSALAPAQGPESSGRY